LEAQRVSLEEYPQTQTNLTETGSLLYELIDSQRLEVYPDTDFRQQIQNVVAVETTRGFRIAKEESGRKIDLIAALSFACVAVLTLPNQASLVYRDYWNDDIHVIPDFSVPMDWQKYRALDFGVETPFVCLFVAKSEEDEFFVYDEIYQSGKTSSEWAEILRARENERYETFEFTVADPSAENQIRTFCSYDIPTIGCWNSDIGFGIEQVKKLLKKHPRRGTPKLRVMARCTNIIREFNHYSIQRTGDRNIDEKPVKSGDKAMNTIRYFAVEISRWMTEIVEMTL
jgi:DNA-binding transcriptional MerR regulator